MEKSQIYNFIKDLEDEQIQLYLWQSLITDKKDKEYKEEEDKKRYLTNNKLLRQLNAAIYTLKKLGENNFLYTINKDYYKRVKKTLNKEAKNGQ